MNHPTNAAVLANTTLLEKLYSDIARGDLPAVLAACADQITFQVPGKSLIAGKYDKHTFGPGLIMKKMELTGGIFKLEAHDFMASDRHGTVLATEHVTRNGKSVELRTVHVWRFENGKPVAWYEYPRDLYQFDAIWS